MTKPNWTPLVGGVSVPANPVGFWTKVYDYVSAPRRLRIVARGSWNMGALKCGPDGDLASGGGGLVGSALVGSLIAKIGGGTADFAMPSAAAPTLPVGSPLIFPVGSFCTIDLPQGASGALFLTINNIATAFPHHGGAVNVDIDESWS
jgi:hypothetical protein